VSRAIVVERFGGPEVLQVRDREPLEPGPGGALVTIAASGVNFVDVYHRTGQYPNPLPFTPGTEAAGTVAAVGPDVTDVRVGDRVAWTSIPGSYAEEAVVPADRLVPIPDGVDFETAAAVLLQGMTAHYLVRDSYQVKPGETYLVHAAAGGMGLLLTQLIKHLGGRVVGTTSTPEKEKLAREAGADIVVPYDEAVNAVREATGGAGVPAVYDGVGAAVFETNLTSIRVRGTFVSYGSASGPLAPIDPGRLSGAGSIFFTRPTLAHFIVTREELLARAGDVFGWVNDGTLTVRVSRRYPWQQARTAHEDLQARRTTGKLLLVM
jgi:NADPH2:quinone reductase